MKSRCTCSLQDIADTVPDELHEEECERAGYARFRRLALAVIDQVEADEGGAMPTR